MHLRPASIYIEPDGNSAESLEEIKYTFRVLLTIIGVPWRFVSRIDENGVDICYGRRKLPARIFIRKSAGFCGTANNEPTLIKDDDRIFLTFTAEGYGARVLRSENASLIIENDIVYSAFFLLTGKQEGDIRRKKWDAHTIEDSILYRYNLLHTPLVNQWADLLRLHLGDHFSFAPSWPNNKEYAISLTHDVDYPELIRPMFPYGLLNLAMLFYLKLLTEYRHQVRISGCWEVFKGTENFWKFDEWMQLEKEFGMRSAFYFSSVKGSVGAYFRSNPNPFYDISEKKYRDLFRNLAQDGFEVGLHSSYEAWKSLDNFKKEKNKLEELSGCPIWGNRHHCWHLNQDNPAETAQIHATSGFRYDSSLAFQEHSGFRRSISYPYRLYNKASSSELKILQLPPTLMDDHLFVYDSKTSCMDYREHIDSLFAAIRHSRGVFVVDFHIRALNGIVFSEYKDAYIYLLNKVMSDGDCYADTPANIAEYWLTREKNIRQAAVDETCAIA